MSNYASQHLDRLRDKLRPLMVPPQMASHRLSLKYVLIIGRSAELEHHEARRLRLANYGAERNLRIMTYDTIYREVAAGYNKPKAVLRANSRGYFLQSAEGMPAHMFSYIMPAQLELSAAAEAALRAETYDIDAWKRNEPLNFNEKWTRASEPSLYDGMHSAVKGLLSRQKKRNGDNGAD
ncbi:Shedu anti-phage system protein SduA domain-containing protein (plasmid) [Sphingomonas panni]